MRRIGVLGHGFSRMVKRSVLDGEGSDGEGSDGDKVKL